MVIYNCSKGNKSPETKGDTIMNKVYLVQAHEVYEDISTIRNEIFATKEMAQKCFDEKVKWYKDDIGDDGDIIDDTSDCFSWILESGYADNSIEVCIQECEVLEEILKAHNIKEI